MPATLNIAITDTSGSRRNFQANRASLDCGAGTFEFRAGCPTYCRKFDDAMLTIFQPAGDAKVSLRNCTASFAANALHILCEDFREQAGRDAPAV